MAEDIAARSDTARGARAASAAPPGLAKVSLTGDADDAARGEIVEAVMLDRQQLHGHETPDRLARQRARRGLAVRLTGAWQVNASSGVACAAGMIAPAKGRESRRAVP